MRSLIHEAHRAVTVIPLEARARWHAWRSIRHHDLQNQHQIALAVCMTEADDLLHAR